MMGTPPISTDFALGFSLTEGIVQSADEIETFDCRGRRRHRNADLAEASSAELRQRAAAHIAGPAGCGLCGIESIEEAMRPRRGRSEGTHA